MVALYSGIMAAVREKWTGERLDDMNARMIIQLSAGMFGTMVTGFTGLIVTMFLTQH